MPRKPRLTAEEIARMPKQIPLVIEPAVPPIIGIIPPSPAEGRIPEPAVPAPTPEPPIEYVPPPVIPPHDGPHEIIDAPPEDRTPVEQPPPVSMPPVVNPFFPPQIPGRS